METDFRAFFLLVEIQLLKDITARRSLFVVDETDFQAR